ncbi:MAG TPA: hypothetical protein DFS52_18900 [Myxococcales bacterium]|jgi:dolichol kinase|nr:hypothetical protein [Myxococcales bacterium]
MSTSIAVSPLELQLLQFAEEAGAFLDSLPSHLKKGRLEEARQHCARLLAKAPVNETQAAQRPWSGLYESLAQLKVALESGEGRKRLLAAYEDAARSYEAWIKAYRAAAGQRRALASLKPLIGPRTLFHMSMGVLCTVLYQFVLTRAQSMAVLLTVLGVFLSLEISRRFFARWNDVLVKKVFRLIARPHEYYRVNSSTWYLLALCFITPVFSRPAVLAGVLVLGFADPAAAWFGRRFGTLKLYGKKSLQGSLAFLVAGTLVAAGFLLGFYPDLPLASRLAAGFGAALAGAAAELFTDRLDDNLTIPIASTLAAALFV